MTCSLGMFTYVSQCHVTFHIERLLGIRSGRNMVVSKSDKIYLLKEFSSSGSIRLLIILPISTTHQAKKLLFQLDLVVKFSNLQICVVHELKIFDHDPPLYAYLFIQNLQECCFYAITVYFIKHIHKIEMCNG